MCSFRQKECPNYAILCKNSRFLLVNSPKCYTFAAVFRLFCSVIRTQNPELETQNYYI